MKALKCAEVNEHARHKHTQTQETQDTGYSVAF